MLSIYIGYDPRESVAYHTLAHSILRRASVAVSIAPVMQSQLKGLYTRPRGPTESTEEAQKNLSALSARNSGKFTVLTTKRLEEITQNSKGEK